MQNQCKAILLATDNPTFPCLVIGTPELGLRWTSSKFKLKSAQYFHLYITSTEEIKEEDWIIITNEKGENYLRQCEAIEKKYCVVSGGTGVFKELCTKIIATTDSSLIIEKCRGFIGKEYSLPTIPKSFIELHLKRYNESNPIVDVLVEYEEYICPKCKGSGEYVRSRGNHSSIYTTTKCYCDKKATQLKLNGNEIIISEAKSS